MANWRACPQVQPHKEQSHIRMTVDVVCSLSQCAHSPSQQVTLPGMGQEQAGKAQLWRKDCSETQQLCHGKWLRGKGPFPLFHQGSGDHVWAQGYINGDLLTSNPAQHSWDGWQELPLQYICHHKVFLTLPLQLSTVTIYNPIHHVQTPDQPQQIHLNRHHCASHYKAIFLLQ